MPADLLVRNARLAGRDGVCDLAIEGGRFTRIGTDLDVDAKETIDAEGRLASPPLVDCHLHLDASLTAGKPRHNESGTLLEGIQVWGELKPSLTVDDVVARATEIVRWSAAQGRSSSARMQTSPATTTPWCAASCGCATSWPTWSPSR